MRNLAILLLVAITLSILTVSPVSAYSHCRTDVSISYITPGIPSQGETVTIFGSVNYANTRVDIYLDGSFVASVWPDSNGSWSYSYYSWLYQGSHRFDVYAQYDACVSDSDTYSFTVTGTTYPPYYPPSFSGCVGSVAVETPDDVYKGDSVASTITISNSGNSGGSVNFNAFLCRESGGCELMDCKSDYIPYDYYSGYYGYYNYGPNYYGQYYTTGYYGSDPYVYMPAHSTASFVCSQTSRNTGTYRIRVDAYGCGLSRSVFSSSFLVRSSVSCSSGYQDEYRCFGNERQRKYGFVDCSSEWRTVETCSYGCSNGACNPQTSVSTVTTTVTQPVFPTGYFVWTGNVNTALLVLVFIIAIIILLFVAMWNARYERTRRAEWYRI